MGDEARPGTLLALVGRSAIALRDLAGSALPGRLRVPMALRGRVIIGIARSYISSPQGRMRPCPTFTHPSIAPPTYPLASVRGASESLSCVMVRV